MCALENIASFIGNYFVTKESIDEDACFLFCLNMMEGNKYDGLWNEFLCYALLFYTKQFWAIFFFKLSKNWITQKSFSRMIFLKFRIYSIVYEYFPISNSN